MIPSEKEQKVELTKICPNCKIKKTAKEYYIHKTGRRKGKFITYCIVCENLKNKSWRDNHRGRETERKHFLGKTKTSQREKRLWSLFRSNSCRKGII